jgi:cell division transport system ATP-binding protein
MIVFENVSKSFLSGTTALDGVSFEIADEEFVFLIGHSGAGKTTVLKLIIHELSPTSGSIIVDDFNLADKKFNQTNLLRRKIGMVFQDFKILYDKNIFENVALALQAIGFPSKKIKEEVNTALSFVGLEEKKWFFPIQLSIGEIQRAAIARAIVGDKSYLLADEPTGNLDPKTSWEILHLFKKIAPKKTVIIATHNSEIVNSFKKRVIALEKGRVIKDLKKGGYVL